MIYWRLVRWCQIPTGTPKAYLNYLVFDLEHNPIAIDAANPPWQNVSSAAASGTAETLDLDYTAETDGYMYIYVANETQENVDVYFDDLTITHTGINIVQSSDYYPGGLVMRESKEEGYRFGYQGQFAERDSTTGWNHFELRQYDSRIGRWLVVDPKRIGFSPYIGMGNSPVRMVDPDGGGPGDPGLFASLFKAAKTWFTNFMIPATNPEKFEDMSTSEIEQVASSIETAGIVKDIADHPTSPTNYVRLIGGNKSLQALTFGISSTVVAGGGATGGFGYIIDRHGNGAWYTEAGVAVGLDATLGGYIGQITLSKSNPTGTFMISDYHGTAYSNSKGLWFSDLSYGGDTKTFSNWNYGRNYYELRTGVSIGSPIGWSLNFTRTTVH